jgi:hypothetical protein
VSDERAQLAWLVCLTVVVACGTTVEPPAVTAPVAAGVLPVRFVGTSGGFTCPPAGGDWSVRTYPTDNPGGAIGQTFPDFAIGLGYLNLSGEENKATDEHAILSMHDLYCSGFKLAFVHVAMSWCPPSMREIGDLEGRQKAWLPKGGVALTILEDDNLNKVRGVFPFDYSIAVDTLGDIGRSLGLDAWPTNFIVQLSGMTIVDEDVGYQSVAAPAKDPLVAEFETLLDLLQ